MIPAAVNAFKLEYLPTLSYSARKEHGRLLDIFSNDFEQFTVAQITSVEIRRSIKNLYGGKPTAAKHYKSRISRFFRWCVEEAALRTDNPCREVWLSRPPKRKTKWTDELFISMREKLPEMHQCYHDLCFLLYQRTTDVRLLLRSQIENGVIHFQPSKTEDSSGAEVNIPITPEIQAVLDRAAALSKKWKVVCAYVIHTRGGTAYSRSGIYSAYRRADEALHAGKAIGLNPKAIRPFAATSATKQGYGIEDLKVGLAHASLRTSEGYVHQHDIPISKIKLKPPIKKSG